jgi:hypothetical protein
MWNHPNKLSEFRQHLYRDLLSAFETPVVATQIPGFPVKSQRTKR